MWREYDFIIPSPFCVTSYRQQQSCWSSAVCCIVTGVLCLLLWAQLSSLCRMRVEEELWGYITVLLTPTGGYICQSSVSKVASFPELFMYLILCHLHLEIIRYLKSTPKHLIYCCFSFSHHRMQYYRSPSWLSSRPQSHAWVFLSLTGSFEFIRKSCYWPILCSVSFILAPSLSLHPGPQDLSLWPGFAWIKWSFCFSHCSLFLIHHKWFF